MPLHTAELNPRLPCKIEDVPQIEEFLDPDNFMAVIPPGYEDMVSAHIDKLVPDKPKIVLTFQNPEYRDINTIDIPLALFNSRAAGVDFPKFLFEMSTVSKTKIDYFGINSSLILNGPQMLYLVLQHRFAHYTRRAVAPNGTKRKIYLGLLNGDLRDLKAYIQHTAPASYNGYRKVEHTYAVISHKAHRYSSETVIGERLKSSSPDEKEWKKILKDLQGYVQPSSESSMSERSKITLYPGQLYRAPGFQMSKDGRVMKWICDSKQNIPARMKTHILSDGYRLLNPATSCFQQDNLFIAGKMVNKDETLRESIVVYRSMNPVTKEYIAGEVCASRAVANELVLAKQSFDVLFRSEADIQIQKGIEYTPNFKPYSIGVDSQDQEVILYNLKSFTPVEIVPNGINGAYKVTIEAVQRAGNARVISQTGVKGVTKVKTRNGLVYLPKVGSEAGFNTLSPNLGEYLKSRNFNKWRRIDQKEFSEDQWERLPVDLTLGMNAVKAKSNTIVLSQAALAVKLGYFVPKPKGKHGQYEGIIDTLDVDEVNDAANSLPEFVFINEFGLPEKAFVGLAYTIYTELGSVYSDFKPQSFAFESGWGIKNNSEQLFRHIRDNYLEEDKIHVAKDLYKILNDPKGLLRKVDNIPSYTAEKIREGKLFKPSRDLFRKRTSPLMSRSNLLSDDFNPNGFYINLKEQGGPLIRVPSARTFRTFIRRLPNGEVSYHKLLLNVSKIISAILGYTEENFEDQVRFAENASKDAKSSAVRTYPLYDWIFDYSKRGIERSYQYDLYMKSVQGSLYSTDEDAEMIVQSLIKPKIPGINMKQVVEPLVPDDVVVVMNKRLYGRICKQAGHEDLMNPLSSLNIDIEYLKTLSEHDNKLAHTGKMQECLDNVPRCLAIRNPSLWESQITTPRIWNEEHLAIWLRFKYNINIHDYLDTFFNQDIVLVSAIVALISHSDCDGDLLPMAVLNAEGQALLKDFKLNDMLEDEAAWNEAYWRDELETDDDLKIDVGHTYKLFTISNVFDPTAVANKNYPQYLLNASSAKANIGPATIDIWALKAVLQWYKSYCERTGFKFIDKVTGNVVDSLPHRLNDFDLKYLPYVYTRLVQEQVIEGIKHVQGGSEEFQMYFLDNITKTSTLAVVQHQLEHKFGVPRPQIAKLLGIIEISIECDNVLKAIKNFISKYNKGKLPANAEALDLWEDEIQANTYFGSLVEPLFAINKQVQKLNLEKVENSLSLSSGDTLGMNGKPSTQSGSGPSVLNLFNMG